ncbi:MAG: RNA polymerase sigma factor [Clostridia bacterium]|nr:RNA polymerase sigma factor [Clostridia bacterium]
MKTKSFQEMLISEFTKNYVEKLFYFCLKKTGDSYEAEDLASDITLNIITELHKGTVPTNFAAWVWQIARNRYSIWTDKKHKRSEAVSGADIADFEIEDEERTPEANLVQKEEISLLRRELAFISSDYRDIVVAYYIEDRKTKDIASSLAIPEGTVKTKLFRARNILKEGMNMAREFGTKSYKPENVYFTASGDMINGDPHGAVQRMLPKNILLEASGNPSTIEELSIELGIAMPYMEEEVALLVERTLLKKLDNGKYITNFFIADKETQLSVYTVMRNWSETLCEMLDLIVSETLPEVCALGIVKNDMTDAELKWWLIIHATDYFSRTKIGAVNIARPPKRENGEGWGFVGYEECMLPEKVFMGYDGNGTSDAMHWSYKISDYGLMNRVGMMGPLEAALLKNIIVNNRKLNDLSETEANIFANINGRFAHADENGNIIPDLPVLTSEDLKKIHAIWEATPVTEPLIHDMKTFYNEIIDILKKNSNPVLHEQIAYYAAMELTNMRMMTVHHEVASGKLTVPANPETSTIAMYLKI